VADLREWELRPDGNLLVGPVLGWDTALAPMNGLLRVEYAHSEEELKAGGKAVQFVLTAAQARELSVLLARLADAMDAENQGPGTRQ